MTDPPGNAEIFDRIRAIAAAPTENLAELIKIAGLDPAKNLRFQDWTGSSFRGNDLRGFDFTGSRLIGCDFADALITGARFDQAEIARVGFETGHQTNLRAAKDWVEFVANWRRREAPMWSFAEALKGASSDRHLRPGMVFQDAPFAPEMAVIPPGRFMMGSPPNEEPGYYDNEGPRHEVTIPQALAVGRYAVTFEEWDFAQGDKDWASVTKDYADDVKWGRGRRPVINVSWDDATDYVTWLARRTGQPYRLLSEAEWEYACRAGTSTSFWWGSSITPDQANYNSNYMAGGSKGEYRGKTLPVESFEPNPWGLYQVHGNVSEWCEDVWYNYEDKPDELKSNGGALTTGDSFLRVIRGGSWNLDPQSLRSAWRSGLDARIRIDLFGFRVARTLNL